jgi:glycosyltransferase involved in cell wall biosynthesis
MVLSAIIILLTIFYGFLIQYYWRAWISIPDFQITNTTPQTNISVIVPARNEESNIGRLLDSLDRQSYPRWLFNVLVVDDNSTDSTAQIVRQYRAVLMQLDGNILSSHKKKAIETGIQAATGDLIVTTDADCTAERDWLNAIAQFKEKKKPGFYCCAGKAQL